MKQIQVLDEEQDHSSSNENFHQFYINLQNLFYLKDNIENINFDWL